MKIFKNPSKPFLLTLVVLVQITIGMWMFNFGADFTMSRVKDMCQQKTVTMMVIDSTVIACMADPKGVKIS